MSTPILSSIEAQVLQNKDFFLSKASIDVKISDLFEALKHEIDLKLQTNPLNWPNELKAQPSRVYRGENLAHLPWRALDCPRFFEGEDMFTFRCLLIWGTSFSFHLLLGGIWHQKISKILLNRLRSNSDTAWQLSIQETPWNWEMLPEHFRLLSTYTRTEIERQVEARNWLKLSISFPLAAFEKIPEIGSSHFAQILEALA
jgi:hypothetical protein